MNMLLCIQYSLARSTKLRRSWQGEIVPSWELTQCSFLAVLILDYREVLQMGWLANVRRLLSVSALGNGVFRSIRKICETDSWFSGECKWKADSGGYSLLTVLISSSQVQRNQHHESSEFEQKGAFLSGTLLMISVVFDVRVFAQLASSLVRDIILWNREYSFCPFLQIE